MQVFAASPGQVAMDGAGDNSTFATALAGHLGAEDTDLSSMKRVIRDVHAATNGARCPWW